MKSVPLHSLVEAQQHVVTVELSSGETYRGQLVQSDDSMNLHLSDVLATAKDGSRSQLQSVFVRGSHVAMLILPEMSQFAPVLRTDVAIKASEAVRQKQQQAARSAKSRSKKPPRKQSKIA